MKTKASIFTKITLGVLLAGSIAACNKTKTDSKPATPPDANKEKIVFVNQDTLLSKYDFAKDVNKMLQEKGKTAQSNIGSRRQNLQREYADYQKTANTMAADQRQITEQRLQREGQDQQSYEQNESASLQSSQATEGGKVFDKIAEIVKGYSKEKGYKLVLTFSKSNPTVLYGDETLNVTSDVIKRLNDAYAKDKK
jgi:outer membrane protein